MSGKKVISLAEKSNDALHWGFEDMLTKILEIHSKESIKKAVLVYVTEDDRLHFAQMGTEFYDSIGIAQAYITMKCGDRFFEEES